MRLEDAVLSGATDGPSVRNFSQSFVGPLPPEPPNDQTFDATGKTNVIVSVTGGGGKGSSAANIAGLGTGGGGGGFAQKALGTPGAVTYTMTFILDETAGLAKVTGGGTVFASAPSGVSGDAGGFGGGTDDAVAGGGSRPSGDITAFGGNGGQSGTYLTGGGGGQAATVSGNGADGGASDTDTVRAPGGGPPGQPGSGGAGGCVGHSPSDPGVTPGGGSGGGGGDDSLGDAAVQGRCGWTWTWKAKG